MMLRLEQCQERKVKGLYGSPPRFMAYNAWIMKQLHKFSGVVKGIAGYKS